MFAVVMFMGSAAVYNVCGITITCMWLPFVIFMRSDVVRNVYGVCLPL